MPKITFYLQKSHYFQQRFHFVCEYGFSFWYARKFQMHVGMQKKAWI